MSKKLLQPHLASSLDEIEISLTPLMDFCSAHPEHCDLCEFQSGDLISLAGEADGLFLLIRTGSIRFIDSSRSFSSLTLSIIDAPYLLASHIFSGRPFIEPVRAATTVSAYQVSISSLPTEFYSTLVTFWKSSLDPREWVLIFDSLHACEDQSSALSPLLDIAPSSWPGLIDVFSQGSFRVIYLDASRSGFKYVTFTPLSFWSIQRLDCLAAIQFLIHSGILT